MAPRPSSKSRRFRVSMLIAALGRENDSICSSAASELGELGDPRALEPLIQVLPDSDIRDEVVPRRGLDVAIFTPPG